VKVFCSEQKVNIGNGLYRSLKQNALQLAGVAGGVKTHKGAATSFKYNIACMQQPGGQT